MLRSVRPSALTTPAVTVDSKPERAADGDDELADAQLRRVAELRRAGSSSPSACTTARSVHGSLPTTRPASSSPSLRRTRTSLVPLDDVVVGQQEAVRREQHAGAAPPRSPCPTRRFTTAGRSSSATRTTALEKASSALRCRRVAGLSASVGGGVVAAVGDEVLPEPGHGPYPFEVRCPILRVLCFK